MLIIRLQRVGKKNEPTFRIVLTDSKNSTKSGKFLEILGSYDARDKNETKIKADRVKELIADGAQTSDTIHNLLVGKGIIEGKKKNVLPKKTPIVKETPEGEAEKAPAAPAEEQAAEPVAEEKAPEAEAEATPEPVAEEKPAEPVVEKKADEKAETPVTETPEESTPKEEKKSE